MLKWLRKYNSYILVVGGALLMIAFLLPQTIQELGRAGFGRAQLKFAGHKVSGEDYMHGAKEYAVLGRILRNPQLLELYGGGETADHWIMLSTEATEAGLVGGPSDGDDLIKNISAQLAEFELQQRLQAAYFFMDPNQRRQQVEAATQQMRAMLNAEVDRASGSAELRMTRDEVLRALAKLHGVRRMREAYFGAPRFSDRRLISGARDAFDSVNIEYVDVPADRELQGVQAPDNAAIQAHFERFKATKKGEGQFGIGYTLPPRVKLSWLVIDRKAVESAISPDPVEVQKRLLQRYGTDPKFPAGTTAESAAAEIETQVRNEKVDRVIRAAEVVAKTEIDRVVRKLDPDGDYRKLPSDWATIRPDFVKIRDIIVARVKDQFGVTIPPPRVEARTAAWLERSDVSRLDGAGSARLRRGQGFARFDEVVFSVRELGGKSDLLMQTGIPYTEALEDDARNRYFVVVLEARKTSPPDSLDEIRDQVVRDMMRLAAFEKLRTQSAALAQQAAKDGIDALTKPREGATGDAATPLTTKRGSVDRKSISPRDPAADDAAFRTAVLDAAAKLDPTKDVSTVDAAARIVSVPIEKSLSVVVAKITGLSPLTVEQFREREQRFINELQSTETGMAATTASARRKNDPFTLVNMEKRLNVEYMDRNRAAEKREAERDAAEESNSSLPPG